MLGRIDLPQFLDADGIRLRVAPFIQVVLGHQLLAEVSARTFSEQRVFGVQLHAELKRIGWHAFAVHTHVAGGDTFDRTIVVVQDFRGRKAGEDFHAQRLGLLAQPARHVT